MYGSGCKTWLLERLSRLYYVKLISLFSFDINKGSLSTELPLHWHYFVNAITAIFYCLITVLFFSSPLINEIIISKLHFVYSGYISLILF